MQGGKVNDSDRRVKRTRKVLQDAFLALMAEKSFQTISVQDIADRADVNRATFYAHFVDKYALLDHVVGEWFRQVLATRVSSASPFTLGNLHALIVAVLEALAEFHGHCKPSDRDLDPLIEARVQQELEAYLLDWLRRLAPPEMEPRVSRETAATVLSWAIFGAGIARTREPRTASADEIAREILVLLSGGLWRVLKLPARVNRETNGTDRVAVLPA
jgi:AcrR family transcriptional regulator